MDTRENIDPSPIGGKTTSDSAAVQWGKFSLRDLLIVSGVFAAFLAVSMRFAEVLAQAIAGSVVFCLYLTWELLRRADDAHVSRFFRGAFFIARLCFAFMASIVVSGIAFLIFWSPPEYFDPPADEMSIISPSLIYALGVAGAHLLLGLLFLVASFLCSAVATFKLRRAKALLIVNSLLLVLLVLVFLSA